MNIPTHVWIAYGLFVAGTIWGGLPGGLQTKVELRPLDHTAQARFPRTIVLSTTPKVKWTRGRTCHVIVHETGHLHGRQHSSNPLSVMFPRFVRVDPRCRQEPRYH
jgi:hypothetical protein